MLCPDHASEKLPFEIDEPDGSDREEAPANGKGGAKKRKAAESARYVPHTRRFSSS